MNYPAAELRGIKMNFYLINPDAEHRGILLIKTEDSELEISIGTDVYLGSRASGQIFKKWDDFEDHQKLRLEILLKKVEKFIIESEKNVTRSPSNEQ